MYTLHSSHLLILSFLYFYSMIVRWRIRPYIEGCCVIFKYCRLQPFTQRLKSPSCHHFADKELLTWLVGVKIGTYANKKRFAVSIIGFS